MTFTFIAFFLWLKISFTVVVIFFAISFAIFLFSFTIDVFIVDVIMIFMILLNFFFFSVIIAFAIFFTFAIFFIASEINLFNLLLLTMLFLFKIFKDYFVRKQFVVLIIANLLNEINDSCFIFLIKEVDCFDDEIIFNNDFLIYHFVLQFNQLNFKIYHVITLRER